jgi:acyl-CoA thioesterase FadM
MVTLSVLIPVHDPNQVYEDYISDALSSISIQKHKPDQVLLVANHEISYLESLRSRFRDTLEIEFKISQANSAAENINFGVRESKGQFVKLLSGIGHILDVAQSVCL